MGKFGGKTIDICLSEVYKRRRLTESQDIYPDPSIFDSVSRTFKNTRNPVLFYESYMQMVQMYFDVSIKSKRKNDKAVADKLLIVGKDLSDKFYNGKKIIKSDYRKKIFPYFSKIKDVKKMEDNPRDRRILREQITIDTVNAVPEMISQIDIVVPILSGGLELGFLLSNFYDAPLFPLRYSRHNRSDKEVKKPKYIGSIEEKIKGKKILITDDCILSGKSLWNIKKYLAKKGAEKIYGVVADGSLEGYDAPKHLKIIHESSPFISLLEKR